MSHKVSKLKDDDGEVIEGEYIYRGVEFRINNVPAGYFGRYEIISGPLNKRVRTKRSNLLALIDELKDAA